jgi:hypothetical protein
MSIRFCAHSCVYLSSPDHISARRTDVDFVLMRFDLSALSGMAPISRALFRYTVQNPGDAAEMHEFRRGWTASTVTYNNLPMPTPPSWPFSAAVIDTYWGPSVNDLAGNAGTQTAMMLAVVGGHDPGRVGWPASMQASARAAGLTLDEAGNLVVATPA